MTKSSYCRTIMIISLNRFNLRKTDPPIPRASGFYSGKIMWARCFQSKLDETMNVLKEKQCIIEHPSIQPTIKLFNSLSSNFLLYEMQQHKAWYDTVHLVHDKLAQPILRRNLKTNKLEINFHPAVFELIRESETMLKLGLGI